MSKRWQADWLADRPFAELEKLDLYWKEMQPKEIEAHREDLRHHHWYVRTTFTLNEADFEAAPLLLDMTADDYYKLYVNGRFAVQGPAQSDAGHYYYNRIDVTSLLRPGRNVIAVHVYYQGLRNRAYNSGDYRQGLIAELSAGEKLLLKTDGSWRAKRVLENGPGVIFGYDTQFTEHLDARLSERGWTEPDFDDTAWMAAEPDARADYTLVEQPTPTLAVYKREPQTVRELAPGHYLLDFGSELTGQFAMAASGEAGQEVEVRCGEELTEDGNAVRYEMRCNCFYLDRWTLSGGEDTFETYDYKGFRYVEVKGPAQALRPDTFRAVVRHYPLDEESCRFQSSEERVNRIFDICKNGVKFGSQENYVDCPTREKGQYLGDNTVIGHSHLLLSGDPRLFRKALSQFARSAFVCEGLMAVVPGHYMQEIADFSLQWPLQVLEYYRQTGDLAFVREMLPYAEGVQRHFAGYDRGDGLLQGVTDKWNLVDWPQELRDEYDFELPRPVGPGCHNVLNAFYLGCVRAVNELRDLTGTAYEDRLPALLQRYREVFYDAERRLFVDAEGSRHPALHSNVLPLLFDLAPAEATEAIVELIRARRLTCGVYFAYFVLKALARVGEHELVYELLSSEDTRSWGNMVKEGATTCYESWGRDQKWNTSLCHPWASAPVPLLIEEIIGLKPAAPGWTAISFTPRLPADWTKASLELKVPTGAIRLVYEQGEWTTQFPEGVEVVRSV